MDYIKKSLQNLSEDNSYEEIDTRLASGWYVDTKENQKKKKFKTKKVSYKISKKRIWISIICFHKLIFDLILQKKPFFSLKKFNN